MSATGGGVITAGTPAEIAARGREVYRNAQAWRLAIQGTPEIVRAMADLLDALETYDEGASRLLAATEVGERTDELVALFPACAVKGSSEEGEQS